MPANLFLTIDSQLVVFTTEDDKLNVMEKLECFKRDMKIKDKMIQLSYVKKGLIFDSTKEIRLHFEKIEEIETFKAAFMKVIALSQK